LQYTENALKYAIHSMLRAIDYLHKHNLAHREISPRHFLVNEHFDIKLSDLKHFSNLNDQMTERKTQAL
jgi:serine/threonine protein kinase